MAYKVGNVDLIRLLVSNCKNIKGDLGENELKTAIKVNDYDLAKNIINKYPNTTTVSCLEEAVESGDIRIAKLLIESGVDIKTSAFKGVNTSIEKGDVEMLRFLLENGASVKQRDHSTIRRLCFIGYNEIAEKILEMIDNDNNKAEVKTSNSKVNFGKRMKFSLKFLCLIAVDKYYKKGYPDCKMEFADWFSYQNLYDHVIEVIYSRRKNISTQCAMYFRSIIHLFCKNQVERAYRDELVEVMDCIVENGLENILNDTQQKKVSKFGYENDIKVLNNIHYEIAKSELVSRNFEMLKLLLEYGADINSNNSLILKNAYKAGDIDCIDYFITKGMKLKNGSDGFEEACRSNKVEVLKHWIKNGGVILNKPEYECINVACILGNFDMIKLLVENGVDLSNPERNGIRIACRLGLGKTLKYLLDNNAVVGNICRYQLEYACLIEDIVLVKIILEYYVDLGALKKGGNIDTKDIKETKDITFLDNVNPGRSEEYKITKTLLEKGNSMYNSDLLNGIRAAIAVANTEILKLLLSYQIDLNDASEILIPVIENENIEVVVLLLENGLNIKGNSSTLHVALRTQNVEIVRLLLQYGAELKSNTKFFGYSPLGKIEIVQLLLSYCSQVGGDSHLLRHAVYKNNLDAVKLLLKDITTLENSEYNYVFDACKNNNMEILKLLFENGARIQKGSESGVIEACENNNLEMLKLLFENGADVNIELNSSVTQACLHNNLEILTLLLERCSTLVLKKDCGLEEACGHKNIEMINLLIKHCADTSEHIVPIMGIANHLNDQMLIDYCQTQVKKLKRRKWPFNLKIFGWGYN